MDSTKDYFGILGSRHGTEGPTVWTIDNYDGEDIWREMCKKPKKEYRGDRELSANQYHKLANALHQWEGAIDELIKKYHTSTNDETTKQQWQTIKDGVRDVCMNMYAEVKADDTGSTTTTTHQGELKTDQDKARDIACIIRGQTQQRKPRHEPPDDENSEEEEEQLICGMSGRQWECLPYPIVIDSGACASVIPTNWCNHVS